MKHTKTRFNRPKSAGIGSPVSARYNKVLSKVTVTLDTYRLALGALKALYGDKAANKAIRMARKTTHRKNVP
jgi:hypothetical protein